jgi:hypothetical protein
MFASISAGKLIIRGTLALTLLGVVAPGTPSASAAATPDAIAQTQAAWSYVSEYTGSPVIDTGRVTDSSGDGVAGATVILFPVLRDPAKGTAVTPLARAITDSNGDYAVRLPQTNYSLLTASWAKGSMNLHVMAFYPGGSGSWFSSIPIAPHTTATPASAATPASIRLSSAGLHQAAGAVPAGGVPGNCSAYSSATTITQVPQIVGYKGSADTHLDGADFVFSTGYSTTVGVGVSAGGTFGSISADGTISHSSTEQVAYENMAGAGSNFLEAESIWNWQEYQCFEPDGHGGGYYVYDWYLTEDSLGGSAGTPGTSFVSAGDCYPSTNLTSVTEASSTQEDWTNGADLTSKEFNIDLSSQDGYTSSASLTYNFNYAHQDFPPYCGVHGYPGTNSAD